MKTKAYGVFNGEKLIFGHGMTYAIYEKKKLAESFVRELHGYYPHEPYNVRAIELDVEEVAHGNEEEGTEE